MSDPRRLRPRELWVLGAVILAPILLALLARLLADAVPLPARLAESPSTVVLYADGSPAHVFLSPDEKYRIAADLGRIDPDYIAALLRFEDKRFFAHHGVDGFALARAVGLNLRHRRVVSGASTLTLQLVRVLEPRPRTLVSKMVEAARAMQLEARLTKREILAAYLSFAPYGGNLEGVEAASQAYFGHGAQDLSSSEIAVLLAVPQRPEARRPSPGNAARLRAARDQIATWLIERGALPEEPLEAAVPERLRPLPRDLPHAARWMRERRPTLRRLPSTLERGVQRTAEEILGRAHHGLRRLGIHNGAVVVLEHGNGAVRALVGNPDFWDAEHGGQIAGFAVARSPGSALKPFLYALAIDRGLALPEHLVADVPRIWDGWAPENYDGRWSGLVELEEALSRSLNLPFVTLLEELGIESFVGTLRQLGAASLSPEPGRYGLSVALGGAELTPLEMAGLYAVLARRGRSLEPHWLVDGAAGRAAARGVPWISPGAAWLTRRALARRDRPDFPERRRIAGSPSHIHWKTGTSYGHRDAWAIGSGPHYTVAVWLGNFDNHSSVDLVGADAAGPILFDLLEALESAAPSPEPEIRPADLKQVEVCAVSGHAPTAACPERRAAWALRARVPTRPCPYHVAVEVDVDRGLAVNPSCRAGRQVERRTFLVWPGDVRRFLAARHRAQPSPPSLAPECEAVTRREPILVEPPPGQILMLVPGVPASDQEVALLADAALGARLSWFVDGEYLGAAAAGETLWWTPRPGRHRILVMDQAGASASRMLEVREADW